MADLSLEAASVDVSDFWRPRLRAELKTEPLPAGLYRFRLQTHCPTYATLRLTLRGLPAAPMTVFPERVAGNSYEKAFSISRAVERLELELEPHLDPNVMLSASIEPVSLTWLLARRRSITGLLTSPRTLLPKARQLWSGKSNLAFAGPMPSDGDPQTTYERWRAVFEGREERARVSAGLRSLCGEHPPSLLAVHIRRNDDEHALPRALAAIDAESSGVRVVPLVIELGDVSLPEDLRSLVEAQGGHVCRCDDDELPIHLVVEQAKRLGAKALVYIDVLGEWSAWAPAMILIELARNPDCMAVYGDSDCIDSSGRRNTPDFKPAWSRRYHQASNYVGSAVAFRADDRLYEVCGGKLANASTSELLLRAIVSSGKHSGIVRHIPRVMFHEYARPHPTARLSCARPSEMLSVNEPPSISVIMPSKNNARLLEAAARSVLSESGDLELVIVDNGSSDPPQLSLLQRLSEDERVRVIRDPRPFNFSALINRGFAVSSRRILVLLNDDVEAIESGWLETLAKVAAQPEAGCVGALLLYPSGRIQHGGVVLGVFGIGGHAYRHFQPEDVGARSRLRFTHEVSAVTGACLAVKREIFSEVGHLDEELPITLNDVDFCLRVHNRGYSNLMVPRVRLVHHESATRGLDAAPTQAERLAHETACFMGKWGPKALLDPFYSPHLTLSREDCSLRDI